MKQSKSKSLTCSGANVVKAYLEGFIDVRRRDAKPAPFSAGDMVELRTRGGTILFKARVVSCVSTHVDLLQPVWRITLERT